MGLGHYMTLIGTNARQTRSQSKYHIFICLQTWLCWHWSLLRTPVFVARRQPDVQWLDCCWLLFQTEPPWRAHPQSSWDIPHLSVVGTICGYPTKHQQKQASIYSIDFGGNIAQRLSPGPRFEPDNYYRSMQNLDHCHVWMGCRQD